MICWLGLMATSILSYPRTKILHEAVRPKETVWLYRVWPNASAMQISHAFSVTSYRYDYCVKKLRARVMVMYFFCNGHNLHIPHQVTKNALWHFIDYNYYFLLLTRIGFTLYIGQNWLKILRKLIDLYALTLSPANVKLKLTFIVHVNL